MSTQIALTSVKTIFTGRSILMHGTDATAYQSLIDSYVKTFEPVGPVETCLVQSLVDTCWRLERIPGLEYALLTMGRAKLAAENPETVANTPALLLEMRIRTLSEKQFRDLQLQENRLVRRRDSEMKELRELQATRKARETEELNRAAKAALLAQKQNRSFDLAEAGFEFSTQKFAAHMAKLTPTMKQNLLKEANETQSAAA